MASKVVKVRGADRVASTMRRAGKEIERSEDEVQRYGELLAKTAQGNAPIRSGRLRRSIVVSGQTVIAAVDYAAPVEFGVRGRMAGRRYMARAVASTERDLDRIFTEGAQASLDKIKGV